MYSIHLSYRSNGSTQGSGPRDGSRYKAPPKLVSAEWELAKLLTKKCVNKTRRVLLATATGLLASMSDQVIDVQYKRKSKIKKTKPIKVTFWEKPATPLPTGRFVKTKAALVKPIATISDIFNVQFELSPRVRSYLLQQSRRMQQDLRPQLRFRELTIIPASIHHTHPKLAAERTGASNECIEMVKQAGRKPFMVSMAASDQLSGIDGTRHFYWPKDMKANFQDDQITQEHTIIMIDVDYYCDMVDYLSYGVPIIMYTLVPTITAQRTPESSLSIVNDEVRFEVSGGAVYRHKIWNYDHEVIIVKKRGFCTWLHTRYIFYHVEQKILDNSDTGLSRRIVTLTPFNEVPRKYWGKTNELERRKYTTGKANVIYNAITDEVSLSVNGSYHSVELSGRNFRAIQHRCVDKMTTAKAIMIGDIEQYLHQLLETTTEVKMRSALLHEVMVELLDYDLRANVSATALAKTQYTMLKTTFTKTHEKAATLTLTTPLVEHPALTPAVNLDNEIASIDGRVYQPANNITPRGYGKYVDEFIDRLVQRRYCGVPIDQDLVKEMQNKALQKARTAKCQHELGVYSMNRLESMLKRELYNDVNYGRNITTCDPKVTLEMSAFTYAMKEDVLKKCAWYGPGLTPHASCTRLSEVVNLGAILTDFSKFDGSVSHFLQQVVRRAYLRWVNPTENQRLAHLFEQVFIPNAKTKHGFKYDPGWGTRSGSPLTTDGNTIINAFIHFVALRRLNFDPNEAYANLGLYAGDDGVSPLIDGFSQTIQHVCREFGLQVKMDVQHRDQPINYLGRIWPAPLSEPMTSLQDLKRTLPKLHLSMNLGVGVDQASVNKAIGYLVTDKHTPILSTYCQRLLREYPNVVPTSMLGEELFKIERGAWPQENKTMIREYVCGILGITNSQLMVFEEQIKNSLDLVMPIVWNNPEPEIKHDALVGDTIKFARNRIGKIEPIIVDVKNVLAVPFRERKIGAGSNNMRGLCKTASTPVKGVVEKHGASTSQEAGAPRIAPASTPHAVEKEKFEQARPTAGTNGERATGMGTENVPERTGKTSRRPNRNKRMRIRNRRERGANPPKSGGDGSNASGRTTPVAN